MTAQATQQFDDEVREYLAADRPSVLDVPEPADIIHYAKAQSGLSFRRYRAALLLVDLGAGLAGGLLAGWLRWSGESQRVFGVDAMWLAPVVALAWLAVLLIRGAYESNQFGVGLEEFRRILSSGSHLFAGLAMVLYGIGSDLSRAYVFGSVAAITALSLVGHLLLRKVVGRQRTHGRAVRRVIVAGTPESVIDLTEHFHRVPQAGYVVAGAVIPGRQMHTVPVGDLDIPVLGAPWEVEQVLARSRVHVLAVADTAVFQDGELRRLAWELGDQQVDLVVAPAIADLAGPRISVAPVAGLPLLHVDEPRFSHGTRIVKAVVDRLGALFGLIVLSPVFAVIAVLVRATSDGPVIFKQERVGLDGSTFKMWKFRSMVVDAEARLGELLDRNESDGLLFKIERDPRVTSVGRVLRRFSLDELPQLVNVLWGQMSLVGPRPSLPSEAEQYDDVIRRRLLVRPGMTGLWQVSGRADLSWQESVRLDVQYVDNWSLALDTTILLKTIAAVFGRGGAY